MTARMTNAVLDERSSDDADDILRVASVGQTRRDRVVVFLAGRNPFDEVSGGHSAYVRSYARAAIMAGFVPHIFFAGRGNSSWESDLGTIHQIASPFRPFRQMLADFHARPLAAAIARFGRGRDEPLLIHSFGVWGVAAIRAAQLLSARGEPEPILVQSSYTTYRDEALAHVRGAGAYNLRKRIRFLALHAWVALAVERWERRAYFGARALLVNYRSVARLIAGRHGPSLACTLMPYAAESAFTENEPSYEERLAAGRMLATLRPEGSPLIVAISRHEPRKGVDVLLRALAWLRDRGVSFRACLIGSGPLLQQHRQLASRLGLDVRVLVTGVVPEVHSFLAMADLYVLPSREEQSGSLAILEALQAGVAVVTSAVDGMLEDLTDGEDALLTKPGDVADLAAAIERVLNDEPLRHRLREQGRRTFEARFSAATFSAALGSIYEELQTKASQNGDCLST